MSHYETKEQQGHDECVCVSVQIHKPLIYRVHHLIVVQLFMLGHPGNEGRHVGDVGYHFIHYIVEVTTVAEVQWGGQRSSHFR